MSRDRRVALFLITPPTSNKPLYVISFIVSDIPLLPAIKNKEIELPACYANVSWSAPVDNGCPLTKYSVYYREIHSREREGEAKVTDVLKTHYVLLLKCDTQYIIEVSAWNEEGQSERSRKWITKTISGKCLLSSICFIVLS